VELQDALATYILEFVPRTFKSQIRMIVTGLLSATNASKQPVILFRIDANVM